LITQPSPLCSSRQFLTATNTMAFVLTVVFVDLIVAVCAELFDPSEEERSRVELFG